MVIMIKIISVTHKRKKVCERERRGDVGLQLLIIK